MFVLDSTYLLAIGIGLMIIEMLLFSFFIIWIGLGFIIVSMIDWLIPIQNGYLQIALSLFIGLCLMLFSRKPLMRYIKRAENDEETQVLRGGMAEVVNKNTVKMHGTFWKTQTDLSKYQKGDMIEVEDIKHNMAIIK